MRLDENDLIESMEEPKDFLAELEKIGDEICCSVMEGSIEVLKEVKEILLELSYNTQTFLDRTIAEAEAAYHERQNPQEVPSEELKQRLYSLVGGNKEIAERLIISEREKNPGYPEKWYWEKIVYDLERDRN